MPGAVPVAKKLPVAVTSSCALAVPLLHTKLVLATVLLATRLVLAPWQRLIGPLGLMVIVGFAFTVATAAVLVLAQPLST